MRFGAHQTFHLRASWLHKGLSAIEQDPKLFFRKTVVEKLGLGKNMVESLRYWLEATQLVEKKENELSMTEIAKEIFKCDRFLELDGTLQLIHYLLASNEESATTWHWFFNKFSANEFETDSLNIYLQSYISTNTDRKIHETTLSKDINCLLRMYRAENYDSKYDPETNNPSPFSRFQWVEKNDTKYTRRNLHSEEIEPLIFVYALYLFWTNNLQEAQSINIEQIAGQENSPGLIFGLSLEQCVEIIEVINRNYPGKYLTHNKSGGYFIVNINKKDSKSSLGQYYNENQIAVEQ